MTTKPTIIEADSERRQIIERLKQESLDYENALKNTQHLWNRYEDERKRQSLSECP